MKNPASTWSFPFEKGNALPKDRDMHPVDFEIPHGHQSLFPVVEESRHWYLSVRLQDAATYFLSPRAGSPVELDTAAAEKQLLAGLLNNLPPRVNSITLFGRIMALPEYLHAPAIDYLEHRRVDSIHESQGELISALRSLNQSMGAPVQRGMSVSKMAREVAQAAPGERHRLLKSYRKEHPEHWIEDARKAAEGMIERAQKKLRENPPDSDFDFRF
ncbi:TPA: hypothetical protein ACGJRU_003037 [Pseudomonas aeruginosa]|uniref:hypothetical protein n=1 Tax=Pseudomonas TaxID=286 RepID=UPI00129859E8|nr:MULTISPECIES: hypothetical protein [Pseudomonas]MBD9427965.1 hypothetical protein [Pseudomonas sp. PDM15]